MENEASVYDASTLLGRCSVHQDLFWFVALLAWIVVLLAWRRHPRRLTSWVWVPGAGAGVIGAILVQFWWFNPTFDIFLERLIPGSVSNYRPAIVDPHWFADMATAFMLLIMLGVWAWQVPGAKRRVLRAVIVPVLLITWFVQFADGAWGGVLMTVLGVLMASSFRRRTQGHLVARIALVLTAVLPLVSTSGVLASLVGLPQRAGPPTPVGLGMAVYLILIGTLVVVSLLRGLWARQHPGSVAKMRRDLRLWLAICSVWMVFGVGIALRSGEDNRAEIQQNRLRTTAARARVFPSDALQPLLSPHFHIETRSAAGEPIAASAPWLAHPRALPAQRQLARVVLSTPFLDHARLIVLHEGWLVAVLSSDNPVLDGRVQLLRRATAEDLRYWSEKQPHVETSPIHEIGYPYYCRAPIIAPDGRMLGWLDSVRREYVLSVQRRWRSPPLLMTALGVALMGLVVVQRQANRERELARRDADEANASNRTKSIFLANVSHELRTPLQNILGYGELLQADSDPELRRAHLDALRGQSELMLRLVNDLIDLSAVESGAFQLVNKVVSPSALVGQAVESLRGRATTKGLELRLQIDSDVPAWVSLDGARLQQVLINLLGNALKFTERGSVAVRLSAAPRAVGRWALRVSVKDTGPGIPLAQQAELFRPFTRLPQTAAHAGSGLGLALAQRLCRAMEGSLTVESDGVSGSCFTAVFEAAEANSPAGASVRTDPSSDLRPRVLIAEDNPLMRELFVQGLNARGAQCRAVSSGESVLGEIEREAPQVLVMDLGLSDGDSLGLLPRVRAKAEKSRVVVVSAHAGAAEKERALRAGADVFLTKPVALDVLWNAIVGSAPAPTPPPAAAALPDYFAEDPAAREIVGQRFKAELDGWEFRASAAVAAEDWAAVRRHAHYLRSGAIVAGAEEIFAAANELEHAASEPQRERVAETWRRCLAVLRQWKSGGAP